MRVYDICTSIEHPTNAYHTLQKTEPNNAKNSLEDLVKQMTTSNIQFQQNVTATIQDLQMHIRQLATIVNQFPQAYMSVITLRSGKELPQQQIYMD
ncbi:hypothetical protein CR513_48166, partial [Mucuna pruriens]